MPDHFHLFLDPPERKNREQVKAKATVSYEKEITSCASHISADVKCIWPQQNIRGNVYTVVREFNMTKGNVFPGISEFAKKVICVNAVDTSLKGGGFW